MRAEPTPKPTPKPAQVRISGGLIPARRVGRVGLRGEDRIPVTVAVLIMIVLQVQVPSGLTLAPRWVLPAVEAVLLLALVAYHPRRRPSTILSVRLLSLGLIGVASAANAWSAVALVLGLVRGSEWEDAQPLLTTGSSIWVTNILVFSLWYWELDRGGSGARAASGSWWHPESGKERPETLGGMPDFVFPEMVGMGFSKPGWESTYVDYLYLAFTNATAFSPTDTLPVSRWSKMAMMLQSVISLATVALVIARAVNILK